MRRPFTKRGSSGYGMSQRSRMGTKSDGGAGEARAAAAGEGVGEGGASGMGAGEGAGAASRLGIVSRGGETTSLSGTENASPCTVWRRTKPPRRARRVTGIFRPSFSTSTWGEPGGGAAAGGW